MEEANAREEEILRAIRQYLNDSNIDTFNDGYDEGYKEGESHAWDEARNKGFDEGWEDACQYILDKIFQEPSGLIFTPPHHKALKNFIEGQGAPACLSFLATNNYYVDQIQKLKVDKDD